MEINQEEIYQELFRRSPGRNGYISQRKEQDLPQILSGVYEGKTTGTPISILIPNQDMKKTAYQSITHLLRPGHANFTYLSKYGIFDPYGGGRASGRETACRVAAGAIAKKLLRHFKIHCHAYLNQIGDIVCEQPVVLDQIETSPIYCPDSQTEAKMIEKLSLLQQSGDSIGGTIGFCIVGCPPGLGDPIYEKLQAKLAKAFLSIPGTKGFEIGKGFSSAQMNGSCYNDPFVLENQTISCASNFSGGVLAGISTGMAIEGKVAFKPASSIKKVQQTLTIEGKPAQLELPQGSRHDPCIAIRAVPVVEAMAALVIADCLLINRAACL